MKWLLRLIPKKWLVKQISEYVGEELGKGNRWLMDGLTDHAIQTPGPIDDAAVMQARSVLDPLVRSPEMTGALNWMCDSIRQRCAGGRVADDGVHIMLRGALRLPKRKE